MKLCSYRSIAYKTFFPKSGFPSCWERVSLPKGDKAFTTELSQPLSFVYVDSKSLTWDLDGEMEVLL